MNGGTLVLDNSVLSAFATAGWFRDLEFWHARYRVATTERIWEDEFTPFHEEPDAEWLETPTVDCSELDDRTRSLGRADWSLLALAERRADPVLVTNDGVLRREARNREVPCIWGTKLLIRTFEECGISVDQYRQGLEPYFDDVHLSDAVVDEVRSAEK